MSFNSSASFNINKPAASTSTGNNTKSTVNPRLEVTIKVNEISEEKDSALIAYIIEISQQAYKTEKLESTIAHTIKDKLEQFEDGKYGKLWHVIVGRSFGSYITFEKGYYIYFYIGSMAFQVFKTP
ncbi:Dynein light chain 1, cytoplasmic [Hanseniaspora osmophila]|uniref:Dynein light chain n=1 Tax=Hanseniaspora osmophila TaxID=56408 RepID=A0A1E5R009_9ASCO|nr:Dynein light chain 1, cytoplasmic [Hanseniaspora osmophila]